uniref:protein-histidine N-methyltransferase n=1 Tax=Culicoides sonorensis TaxID=179676 RepID=A0A336K0U1_CULSO
MGKKTKKSSPLTTTPKENFKKLSMTKRNELNSYVNSLLKLGFIQTINVTEQWNQYVEIVSLLERIKMIESEISVINKKNFRRNTALDEFTKFIEDNGGKINDVKITDFPGYDLGLEALKDFKENEMFITIPDKLVFSFDKAAENVQYAAKMVSLIASMPNISLAFFLMIERLNPNSFWKPYLDVLPERYSTVMYFTPTELNELKGSSALAPALNQIKNIARQYAVLYQIYQQLGEDPKNEIGKLLKERFTYDLYCWAVSTVMTRQNLIPITSPTTDNLTKDDNPITKPALIPFWDMANHTNGHLTTSYNIESHQVESLTLNECKKGEQIFIYYGNRNNTDLLVHNGFVFPNNKNESIMIRLSLSSADKLFTERNNLLEKLDIKASEYLVGILPGPTFISEKLLGFARVFNMTKEQLDRWVESDRAGDLLHIDCAIETECESKAWNFIQNRLSLLLKMSPTTLDEDKELLEQSYSGAKGVKINRHKQMLIQFRVIEKTLLTEALEFAKGRVKC